MLYDQKNLKDHTGSEKKEKTWNTLYTIYIQNDRLGLQQIISELW